MVIIASNAIECSRGNAHLRAAPPSQAAGSRAPRPHTRTPFLHGAGLLHLPAFFCQREGSTCLDKMLRPSLLTQSLPTKHWRLPSACTRIKSLATVAADLQHPMKGVQAGDQE